MRRALASAALGARVEAAYVRAGAIAEEDVAINRKIAQHGLALIEAGRSDQETRRAGQHPDALQRGMAGDGRLGHRDGADLSRA